MLNSALNNILLFVVLISALLLLLIVALPFRVLGLEEQAFEVVCLVLYMINWVLDRHPKGDAIRKELPFL